MLHKQQNGDKMLKDKIKEKLVDKKWTFSEITNIGDVVKELCDSAYDDLSAKEKIDLIWDIKIEEGLTFGSFFQGVVKKTLKTEIAIIVKAELEDATIEFKVDENEVSERSLGGESHKERSADEKSKNK